MGAFGAPSAKLTRLWSSCPVIRQMRRKLTWSRRQILRSAKVEAVTYVNLLRKEMGLSCVNGGPGVRSSQVHPEEYGEELSGHWIDWQRQRGIDASRSAVEELPVEGSSDEEGDQAPPHDAPHDDWADAGLPAVAGFINVPFDRLAV